ncbi:MAG: naiP [Bacillales bacterium]|jgi:putative MFS transporter|nr:naiP [Bacillales bacterium]
MIDTLLVKYILLLRFTFTVKGFILLKSKTEVQNKTGNTIFNIPNKKLLGMAGIGWLFDAMDVGLLSFVMLAVGADWQLSLEQMKAIPSVNSIGMAVGALVFGILADKIGRKNVFILTLLLFSIGSGLTAFSNSLVVFMILRFFIGMGLGGELPVASTMVSEVAPIEQRGRVVVLLESFWAIGWILSAVIAFFVIPNYGWRTAMFISALPAFYAIYLRFHLPDSPVTAAKTSTQSILQKTRIVWSKQYISKTIMLWILWFSVVFSYYGMFLWLPTVMKEHGFTMINSFKYVLIMSLAQLPGYFTAAWLIEKIGRKFVLVSFLLGTAGSAYVFGGAESLNTLLVSGALLSYFNLGAWGGLYAYTPEQYPASIRGTGVGMAAAFGRIGGIIGPLLIPVMVSKNFTFQHIFLVFCIAIFIGVLAVLFLGKETKEVVID